MSYWEETPNPVYPVWTLEEVADALRITPQQFEARRGRLQADHGFPRHLPGIGRRWSRRNVIEWIDRQTTREPDPAAAGALPQGEPMTIDSLSNRYANYGREAATRMAARLYDIRSRA